MLDMRRAFQELYAKKPRLFSAPGRVNLIGEHTDYNEGFVLPFAVNLRTHVAGALREDNQVRVRTFDLQDESTFNLDQKPSATGKRWVNFIHGTAQVLVDRGFELRGADIAIFSQVPIGAGLSSSAALGISVGYALLKLAGADVDLTELAQATQTSEHTYLGTKSGLMDQLTATFAKKNRALFIDCRSLVCTPIAMNIPTMAVVVCNTNVKHNLATSAYNERRRECERAVELLRKSKPEITTLRDLTLNDLDLVEELPEPIRQRCRHVITENDRTVRAAEALAAGDADSLGQLMKLSHESLRADYEVSSPELNVMVGLAESQEGLVGARMMGGGFGGSTVNLVRRDSLKNFCERVPGDYMRSTGLTSSIYVVEPDDGVREL